MPKPLKMSNLLINASLLKGQRMTPRFTTEDIKAQLGEYHLVVAEVIGGLSADLEEAKTQIKNLEKRNEEIIGAISELKQTTRVLIQHSLKNTNDS